MHITNVYENHVAFHADENHADAIFNPLRLKKKNYYNKPSNSIVLFYYLN